MPTSSVSNVILKNIRETSNNTSIAQKLLINRQNKCDQYMAPHFILLRLNPSANPVIVVNAPDKTAATSKANNISYSTPQKEEEAFRINF